MLPGFRKLFLIVLTVGCARPAPEAGRGPFPESRASVPAEMPGANSERTWLIKPATEPRKYGSTISTTVELHSGQGAVRDSLHQKITFSLLTATASGSTSFLGSIEAASTEPGTRMGQLAGVPPAFPLTFTGHTAGTNIIVDAVGDRTGSLKQDCSDMALPTLKAVQRNVFALPATLAINLTWKDSTTFSSCSGMVPTSTIAVRRFRVLGETESDGEPALVLEVSGSSLSSGEGVDGQHRVLINSEGTETARILIDRTTGALLNWDGQEKTTLTVTAGRSQRFTQIVRVQTMLER